MLDYTLKISTDDIVARQSLDCNPQEIVGSFAEKMEGSESFCKEQSKIDCLLMP